MNFNFQRKRVRPNAKCCVWCKSYEKCFDSANDNYYPRLTHRQKLKMLKEEDFRYCKNYKYSKINFRNHKKCM